MTSVLRFVPRVRGSLFLPAGAGPEALQRIMQAAQALGCSTRMEGSGCLCLGSGASGRYSPLSFVDGGTIWLEAASSPPILRYDLSTQCGFLLCAGLSVVAAGLAWFGADEPALVVFGLLAPLLWLYGANLLIARARLPVWLRRQCASTG